MERFGDRDRPIRDEAFPRVEDPWDVHRPERRPRARAVRVDVSRLVMGLILTLLTLLLVAGSVRGQAAPLPPAMIEEDAEESRKPQPKDRKAHQLAADYVDLLTQLRMLADDYRSYYLEVSAGDNDDYRRALEQFYKVIQDSAFYFNYEAFAEKLEDWETRFEGFEDRLAEDKPTGGRAISESLEELNDELSWHQEELEELRRELEEVREVRERGKYDDDELAVEIEDIRREMQQHRAALADIQVKLDTYHQDVGKKRADPNLYRLTRSLRRELEVVTDLFDEDIVSRIGANQDLEAAVESRVRVMVEEALGGGKNVVVRIGNEDGTTEDIEISIDTGKLPGIPPVSPEDKRVVAHPEVLPRPPRPEVPDVDFGGRTMVFSSGKGQVSVVKETHDSIEVVTEQPVYVVNPTGQLEIVGWERPWVRARCDLKVSAATREKAEQLMEQIVMRLYRRSDAVYVEADAPDLSDPRLKVDLSRITIEMPSSNAVVVQSSFGRMKVRDVHSSVKVNGSSTDISLDRVSGGIELSGSQGDMVLSHVKGSIRARNAYGALRLHDCDGDIKVENLNAEVSLADCSGSAEVSNNGPVMISGFEGPVTVHNVNGLIQADNITGDLTARTSLKPIYVSDVRGSVALENANGSVHTENIAGKLRATNSRGPIYAVSPSGPVVLSNRSGNIELLLEHGLSGPSRVDAFDGLVNLRLSGDLDLLLTVESNGGQISSSLPVAVQQSGDRRSARLALGDATQALNVTGTNSDVLIYETR